MIERFKNFLYVHYKMVFLLLAACVMTLGTAIVTTVPIAKNVFYYREIIDAVGGEDKITELTSEKDMFSANTDVDSNTQSIAYTNTPDYISRQENIAKMEARTKDLKNDLKVVLSKRISSFFSEYSHYHESQTNENLNKLKAYVTNDLFETMIKPTHLVDFSSLVDLTLFSELDKETVQAYIIMRNVNTRYVIDLIETEDGWRLSKIQPILSR